MLYLLSLIFLVSPGHKYGEDVLNGRIPVCELTRLFVERHFKDLDKARNKDFQFWYSPERAQHAIDFIQKMKHRKGILRNQPFLLAPHQYFITEIMFGWVGIHEDTGEIGRRFTTNYRENARKEGKTAYAATVANYLTYGEQESGAEVYSFATKKDQAAIVHGVAKSMTNQFLRDNPILKPHFEVLKENIFYNPTESFFTPIADNPEKNDGFNPHGAVGDEVHEFDDDDQINVIETGMGSRVEPMLLFTTTAGFNIYGVCYKIRGDNIKILKGINTDERSNAYIYTLDDDDDWEDEEQWVKPNPNVGVTPYWSYLREQYRKAKNKGGKVEINFKTKNLNIWTTSGDTWIKDDEWMASSDGPFDLKMLYGRKCFVGMDLSTNKDLTALIAIFPPTEYDDKFRVLPSFYCPEDNIPERSKSDRVNYDVWASDGFINATPGKTVDEEYLLKTLEEWKQKYNIRLLEYDPHLAYQLVDKITKMGIKVRTNNQNTRHMSTPIFEIEKLITNKLIDHGQHPVLRWNVSNVMLFTDSNGKKKFDKRKVVDRIDGCVALAMAMGAYLSEPRSKRSKFNDEPLFEGL